MQVLPLTTLWRCAPHCTDARKRYSALLKLPSRGPEVVSHDSFEQGSGSGLMHNCKFSMHGLMVLTKSAFLQQAATFNLQRLPWSLGQKLSPSRWVV